jgi:hypothetical protein
LFKNAGSISLPFLLCSGSVALFPVLPIYIYFILYCKTSQILEMSSQLSLFSASI